MQNKYLSALRTKYASFGLSKEALDRVALQRVKTIANEDEIDADIASTDTAMLIMKEMQGSADAQRNRAAQIQKELDDLKQKQQPDGQKPDNQNQSEFAQQMKTMMMIQHHHSHHQQMMKTVMAPEVALEVVQWMIHQQVTTQW